MHGSDLTIFGKVITAEFGTDPPRNKKTSLHSTRFEDSMKYWFGVTYTLTCPVCGDISTEREAVSSDAANPPEIHGKEYWLCLKCQHELPFGTRGEAEAHPGTPESLRAEGFVIPEDF